MVMETLTQTTDSPSFLPKQFQSTITVIDPNDVPAILFKAIREKNLKLAYSALELNIDVNGTTDKGLTPLFLAVVTNNPSMLELLLEVKADPAVKNRRGETPLLRASFWGYTGVVELLLEKGKVNPNDANPMGWTPLHKAAFQGHVEIVSLLLKYGADASQRIQTVDGEFTPFKLAQWYGQEQTVRLFKSLGIAA